MIHGVLQFTLRIAFCCVLHRCKSQDIHRAELFMDFVLYNMTFITFLLTFMLVSQQSSRP
eukprot:EC849639.1.p3 GENE.EC849639.1~~EC849639.1.p3  ORF type:complete len:60 (-),score=5.30 EC849639.1:4-183(-)